jgi:hypothetical protein
LKNNKILVQHTEIYIRQHEKADYISLTDIARYKDAARSEYILQNWMRNRETIEFLGLCEKTNNESFLYANEVDVLNVALFGLTAKEWRESNSDKEVKMIKSTAVICLGMNNRKHR